MATTGDEKKTWMGGRYPRPDIGHPDDDEGESRLHAGAGQALVELGLCGCGDPLPVAVRLVEVLAELALPHPERTMWRTEDGIDWFLPLYVLDAAGLIEHGGSVGAGWITDSGRAYLDKHRGLLEHLVVQARGQGVCPCSWAPRMERMPDCPRCGGPLGKPALSERGQPPVLMHRRVRYECADCGASAWSGKLPSEPGALLLYPIPASWVQVVTPRDQDDIVVCEPCMQKRLKVESV